MVFELLVGLGAACVVDLLAQKQGFHTGTKELCCSCSNSERCHSLHLVPGGGSCNEFAQVIRFCIGGLRTSWASVL